MSEEFFVDNLKSAGNPKRPSLWRLLRSPWFLFALILIIFLLIWPVVVGFQTELLWFQETGYVEVFRTALLSKLALGAGAFLVAGLFIWSNLKLALRFSAGRPRMIRFISVNKEQVAIPDIAGFIERWLLPLSLLGGLWFGMTSWSSWETVQQYIHRVPFLSLIHI